MLNPSIYMTPPSARLAAHGYHPDIACLPACLSACLSVYSVDVFLCFTDVGFVLMLLWCRCCFSIVLMFVLLLCYIASYISVID